MRLLLLSVVLSACSSAPAPKPAVDTPPSVEQTLPAVKTSAVPSARMIAISTTQEELQLTAPGVTEATFVKAHPACELQPGDADNTRYCRTHGRLSMLPSEEQCEGGCTWWRYTFTNEVLSQVRVSREVFDADQEYFDRFSVDANTIAEALDREFSTPLKIEHGKVKNWAAIEAMGDEGNYDERVTLHRRIYRRGNVEVVWWLGGIPGHHPGAALEVLMSSVTAND